jgi:hypothetical protein
LTKHDGGFAGTEHADEEEPASQFPAVALRREAGRIRRVNNELKLVLFRRTRM